MREYDRRYMGKTYTIEDMASCDSELLKTMSMTNECARGMIIHFLAVEALGKYVRLDGWMVMYALVDEST